MTRIPVAVSGDHWCNRDSVVQDIAAAAGTDQLIFEINTEGPSLHALGIVSTIQQEIKKIGVSDNNIWIDRWHNTVETIPFRRAYRPLMSHFFWMSNRYRFQQPDTQPREFAFGFFLGRVTVDRACIMHDLYNTWHDTTLFSLMTANGHELMLQHDFSEWTTDIKHQDTIRNWFYQPPVGSITGHRVRDQYIAEHNTNSDIVRHYNRFAVEISCETYCRGDTFFPTEKTVRPISQGKPMILYGPKHFLKRLRDLGFETWGTLWDESYDQLEGAQRWQAMKLVIAEVAKNVNGYNWQHISQHNQIVLEDIIQRFQPG
jgi:hypothetical protein